MGLGKTLQSLITAALICLELSIIEDNSQRNNEVNKIDRLENNRICSDITTAKVNKTKKNDKNDRSQNKKKTKNENVTNSLPGGRSLVICPASLTLHWDSEIKKFFPYNNLLISQLYSGNYDSNSNDINNNNDNDNDNNSNNNKNNRKNSNIDNNKNVNSNRNDNSMESDPSSSFSPCTVIVASYDSVRKNNLNFFTDQVRTPSILFII